MRHPKRSQPLKVVLARQLRVQATPGEKLAWSLFFGRKLLGLKFRRQHVIDGFIVDFYCPALRLVVEIDGSVHDEYPQAYWISCARICSRRVVGG
jgi:very-short-patch-repair endonuclease